MNRSDVRAAGSSFLAPADDTPRAAQLFAADLEQHGYVMNLTRLWAHQPSLRDGLVRLVDEAASVAGLTMRDRGVLISAGAAAVGDAYCSLAWGNRLAEIAGGDVAGGVIAGSDIGLDGREQALATWARWVASDPNAADAADVDALRAAGYNDPQIFAATVFVALRVAFAAVNDVLGAPPDAELLDRASASVRDAVTFGRRPAGCS